jgi:hypothetical protein
LFRIAVTFTQRSVSTRVEQKQAVRTGKKTYAKKKFLSFAESQTMTVPKSGAKYNARLCPPYQVTHTSCQVGKVITGSKHRVTFAFGFADPEALDQGLTGPEARGEEHEVKLVWSHTSGKRQVIADNQEVHFSVGKKLEPRFETSWTMEGGHTVKIVAHSTLASFNTTPGFRQFELFLDGMSYFSMPKIYELGLKPANGRYDIVQSKGNSEYYRLQDKQGPSFAPEGRDFAQAPNRTGDNLCRVADDVSEPGKHLASVESPAGVVDMANAQVQDFFWSDGRPQDLIESVAVPELHSPRDEFAPVEAVTKSPSFALALNQILSAYCPTQTNTPASSSFAGSALVPYGAGSHAVAPCFSQQQASLQHYNDYPQPVQQQYDAQPPVTPTRYYEPSKASYHTPAVPDHQQCLPQPVVEQYYQTPTYAVEPPSKAPTVALTMAPLTVEDIEDRRVPEMTGMAKAVHCLVNLNDINEKQASPEDRKFEQKKQQSRHEGQSKPLPPRQPDWSLGLQPNLQAMKGHAPAKSVPKKEIMRPHVFDPNAVHAGMMVAYGSQPPLQPQPMMMHHAASYYR